MIAAVTLVPWYGIAHGYRAIEWLWFVLLISYCEMSITAGYHRLWSHAAYKARPVLRVIYALGGAFALQNNCLTWAADHRRHHLHADDDERDPYSAGKGLWYSHFGWMIRDYPVTREDLSNVRDLLKDPVLIWQRKHYLALVLLMNIGLPVLIGAALGDVAGCFLLLGVLRLVLSQHFTYLINSAAHRWGKRTYDPRQSARDNWFIALFTYGEGYHNYHHTFAWDYRNGVRWYHYDPTKWLLNCLAWCRLATDLRKCSSYRIEMTRVGVQFKQALLHCDGLHEPGRWRERIEAEYSQLVQSLEAWAEAQQAWYQTKSRSFSDELQHDIAVIKRHYRQLKLEMRHKRASWQQLLSHVARSRLQPV
ncbi:MAG TPA: fatty acid desaturase [Candidatus Acidoferrum sp.]|nr:fatty acid desaturase [Candidatus Acidoferrum sp.]